MHRVVVLYEQAPDAGRYEQHAALCRRVPGGVFRHGPVTRTLFGRELAYYAEWEFLDEAAFRAAAATDEFRATGADAAELNVPHNVYVVPI